jgi:hypothetical protein
VNPTLHLAGHKFCFIPTVLQMDPAKSAADNFGLIPANSDLRGALCVHARSQITRGRADFDRFFDKSEN